MRKQTVFAWGSVCLVALAFSVFLLPRDGVGQISADASQGSNRFGSDGASTGAVDEIDVAFDVDPELDISEDAREVVSGSTTGSDFPRPDDPPRPGGPRQGFGRPIANRSYDLLISGDGGGPLRGIRDEISRTVDALGSAEGDEAVKQVKRHLESLLQTYFDADMQQRQHEIQQIEERLAKLKAGLKKRQENKQRILQLQMQVFENEAAGMGLFRTRPTPGGFGGGPFYFQGVQPPQGDAFYPPGRRRRNDEGGASRDSGERRRPGEGGFGGNDGGGGGGYGGGGGDYGGGGGFGYGGGDYGEVGLNDADTSEDGRENADPGASVEADDLFGE